MYVLCSYQLVLFLNELMYYPYLYTFTDCSGVYIMYMVHACVDSYVFAFDVAIVPPRLCKSV